MPKIVAEQITAEDTQAAEQAAQTTPHDPKDTQRLVEPSSVQPKYAIYEEVNGRPYAVDFFGFGDEMWTALKRNPELDSEGFLPLVRDLDEWGAEEIAQRRWIGEVGDFDRLVQGAEIAIGTSPDLSPVDRMKRLRSYVGLLRKQRTLNKEKQALIDGLNAYAEKHIHK